MVEAIDYCAQASGLVGAVVAGVVVRFSVHFVFILAQDLFARLFP